MKDLEAIKEKLKKLQDTIKDRYKAEVVGIFGSYVRGEQKKGSDLDILVRFEKGATLFDLVGLADFLEQKLKMKVDVVSERAVRPELKVRILKEMMAI